MENNNTTPTNNMNKKTIYSHSRLSTFEQCPLKFKFQYIDKLPPEIEQTIEGFLGNKVHDTLEWIYNQVMNKEAVELDQIIENYAKAWTDTFNPGIKIVKQGLDEKHYFNRGIKFLVDYFTKHSPFKDNTIATEKRIFIDINGDGKYCLQGFIDRLVHNKETNVFEIHDYKTGQIKNQEELDKDRQLALYSLGIKQQFNAQEVHLVWHFLDFNQKMTSKRTDEQLEELKQNIIRLIDKIESTKEYPARPSGLCGWCGFQKYCPKCD